MAASLPTLPGIGVEDHRTVVDPTRPPWNAIAKIQTNIATRCTGVLVAPNKVLTAAHCLYNRRTHALLDPGSLHVLFGYERGAYRWHVRVASYVVGNGYEAGRPVSDWARLELAQAIPPAIRPLAVAGEPAGPDTAIALPGYSQDRSQLLMADIACRITGTATIGGAALLTHDCAATRGTSGGPLLAKHGESWEVVGLNIAATSAANLALPAAAFADRR
jgi:protease YdgD